MWVKKHVLFTKQHDFEIITPKLLQRSATEIKKVFYVPSKWTIIILDLLI